MLLHMDISTSSNSSVTPELEDAMCGQLGEWFSGEVPEITVENLSQIFGLALILARDLARRN